MYQLGFALLDEEPTTVIRIGGRLHRLDGVIGEAGGRTLDEIIADWPAWRSRIGRIPGAASDVPALDEANLNWLPPLARPPKLICIGTNYADHIAEMGCTTCRASPTRSSSRRRCSPGRAPPSRCRGRRAWWIGMPSWPW